MFSPGLEISHQWKFCHHQTGQFLASANYKSQRVPKFCFLAELCKKSFMFPKKSRWQFSRFYLHIEFRQNFYQQSTEALALPLVTRLVDNAGLTLQFLRYESPPAPKSQGEGGGVGNVQIESTPFEARPGLFKPRFKTPVSGNCNIFAKTPDTRYVLLVAD